MKTVVIYKSKTGFAKSYAEWIGEDLDADVFESSKITWETLASYDIIIYGAGLYATGINGVSLITGNLHKLTNKNVVVFATGATPSREETTAEIRDRNFTSEQQEHIKFFYLRGGFDYQKLNLFDKLLMTLLKWKLRRKPVLTTDERGMLKAYDHPLDATRKKNITDLIAYVKGFTGT